MPAERPAPEFPWTANHRRALLILLSVFLLVSAGRYACNHVFLNDPPPDSPPRALELADRLDPNTATWQQLAAIHSLGDKKAKAIVAFREKWQETHPGMPAFTRLEHLREVKGIGPATVSNMEPFLVFPEVPNGPRKK